MGAVLLAALLTSPTNSIGSGRAQQSVKRRVNAWSTRGCPLTVTDVRNSDGDDWLERVEIGIRNDSDRPVYYISMFMHFPELPKTPQIDGIPRGYAFRLYYGRGDLVNTNMIAESGDVPLEPGGKHVFKIPEPLFRGMRSYLKQL